MTSAIIELGGKTINMCHDPKDYDNKYELNLVGHVHTDWKIKKFKKTTLLNVGVDMWDFTPISIQDILKELQK